MVQALVNKATFTKQKKKTNKKTNLKRTGQAERISCSKAQRCKKALFYSGHEAGRYNVKWRRGGGLRERQRVPGDELGHIMRTKHPE